MLLIDGRVHMHTALASLAILSNAALRSCNPCTYVPAQATCSQWYGSPLVARTVATVAEFAFYRQVAATLGLGRLWGVSTRGYLFWLWFIGESLSWTGLLLQDQLANAVEDIVWAIWFAYTLTASQRPSRLLLIPIVTYYFVAHIPSLFAQLNCPPKDSPPLVDKLGKDGAWVVPSVIVKAVLFFIFLLAQRGD